MTIEKAIQWFEARNKATTMPGARKMAEMAIAALRAQLEQENPKPLTLDELREMDGEPIWCVSIIAKKSEWAILRIVETPKTWLIAVAGAAAGYGDKDAYGKTWLAYRNRPKEEN